MSIDAPLCWPSSRVNPPASRALAGCDSLVNGSGYCSWQLWGSVAAAAGGGPEVEQSLRVRWLAGESLMHHKGTSRRWLCLLAYNGALTHL